MGHRTRKGDVSPKQNTTPLGKAEAAPADCKRKEVTAVWKATAKAYMTIVSSSKKNICSASGTKNKTVYSVPAMFPMAATGRYGGAASRGISGRPQSTPGQAAAPAAPTAPERASRQAAILWQTDILPSQHNGIPLKIRGLHPLACPPAHKGKSGGAAQKATSGTPR